MDEQVESMEQPAVPPKRIHAANADPAPPDVTHQTPGRLISGAWMALHTRSGSDSMLSYWVFPLGVPGGNDAAKGYWG